MVCEIIIFLRSFLFFVFPFFLSWSINRMLFFVQVYSAAGDGTDKYTCRLWAYAGTSMSCPIVAGAAAMVCKTFVIKPRLKSSYAKEQFAQ